MAATSKSKLNDSAEHGILRAADDDGSGSVLVGNEQVANTYNDEDAADRDEIKGPAETQWPVDGRDMRLKENKAGDPDVEDGAAGMVKGPDPAQHPDRPWADEVGVLDPDVAGRPAGDSEED
jgi:hypothetical protein